MIPHYINELFENVDKGVGEVNDRFESFVNRGLNVVKSINDKATSLIMKRTYNIYGTDSNQRWRYTMTGREFKKQEHGESVDGIVDTSENKSGIRKFVKKITPKGLFKGAQFHKVDFTCAITGKTLPCNISFHRGQIILDIKGVSNVDPPTDGEYDKYLYDIRIEGVDNAKSTKDILNFDIEKTTLTEASSEREVITLKAAALKDYLDDKKDRLEISFQLITLVDSESTNDVDMGSSIQESSIPESVESVNDQAGDVINNTTPTTDQSMNQEASDSLVPGVTLAP